MLTFAQTFAGVFVALLWVLMFVRFVLAWVDRDMSSRPAQVVFSLTEPLLAPLRRWLPRAGAMDLAGLIVLILLGMLWRAFLR